MANTSRLEGNMRKRLWQLTANSFLYAEQELNIPTKLESTPAASISKFFFFLGTPLLQSILITFLKERNQKKSLTLPSLRIKTVRIEVSFLHCAQKKPTTTASMALVNKLLKYR